MPRAKPQATVPTSTEPKAPAVHTEKTSRSTVTVACKLPFSGFELQACEERMVEEQTMTGIRSVKQFFKTGKIYVLRGTAYPRGTVPEGFPERPEMVGGAVLNRGVPRDLWERWLHQNRHSHYVTGGFIFAHEDVDFVIGKAKDEAEILTGMEPINTRTVGEGENKRIADPRIARSTNGTVTNIAPDEDSSRARRAA